MRKIWASQGFAGRLVDWAAQILGLKLEIVRKEPGQRGFQVQPKRWAVEICQAQCTHGVCCSAASAVSVQMRRLYQPGG
ncbi:hypothetical protein ACFYQA_27845, partial [Streptomyces sp. NPDC005774]